MKLSEVKNALGELNEVNFILPDGSFVPKHFHITEVGAINKKFIDCGGTLRDENLINFQLWEDGDFDHRLGPEKMMSIIKLSEEKLGLEDLEVEVEYQGNTIGKYELTYESGSFILQNKQTDCLAKDKCGVPTIDKKKVSMANIGQDEDTSCTPGSGCC